MHLRDAKKLAHDELDDADRRLELLVRKRGDVSEIARDIRLHLRYAARLLGMDIPNFKRETKGSDV